MFVVYCCVLFGVSCRLMLLVVDGSARSLLVVVGCWLLSVEARCVLCVAIVSCCALFWLLLVVRCSGCCLLMCAVRCVLVMLLFVV